MHKLTEAPYGKERMTVIVHHGTMILVSLLTTLLVVNGLLSHNIQFTRILVGLAIIGYLLFVEYLIRHKRYLTSAWLIVCIYGTLATFVLLVWSLNASIGILAISFTVLLAGTILGTKYISSVTIAVILAICGVQIIHDLDIFVPDMSSLSKESHLMDVLAYATIIGIFALVSWLSGKQTEHTLKRALKAEAKIKAEKINLVERLREQSIALRESQLKDMANLYKFATIGQSTTATLHELSNQLSILSLDIDDLHLRHRQSKALQNAKEGIDSINLLVRQTRRQLQDNSEHARFNAIPIIDNIVREFQPKFTSRGVALHKSISRRISFHLMGDSLNLSHVVTILINNALDACIAIDNATIQIIVTVEQNRLVIHIIDNGHGIPLQNKTLFEPHKSMKPNGLGIGLYITKQIVESQFKGKITANQLTNGMDFKISLPQYKK